MDNFNNIMRNKTDEELVNIVYFLSDQYQCKALEAAQKELLSRNIDAQKIVQLKEDIMEINVVKQRKSNEPLQTYWKVLTFIFPGILSFVFAMLFTADGYYRRTKEMWWWTFYGFCFYVVLVLLVTIN